MIKKITCRQALAEIEGIIRKMVEDAQDSRVCSAQKAEAALDLAGRCREYMEATGEGCGSLPEGGRKMKPIKSTEKDLGM